MLQTAFHVDAAAPRDQVQGLLAQPTEAHHTEPHRLFAALGPLGGRRAQPVARQRKVDDALPGWGEALLRVTTHVADQRRLAEVHRVTPSSLPALAQVWSSLPWLPLREPGLPPRALGGSSLPWLPPQGLAPRPQGLALPPPAPAPPAAGPVASTRPLPAFVSSSLPAQAPA